MLENLQHIKEKGIESFLEEEKKRWKCSACGSILSVHREACVYCGSEKK